MSAIAHHPADTGEIVESRRHHAGQYRAAILQLTAHLLRVAMYSRARRAGRRKLLPIFEQLLRGLAGAGL